jgi:hypothetical protein
MEICLHVANAVDSATSTNKVVFITAACGLADCWLRLPSTPLLSLVLLGNTL